MQSPPPGQRGSLQSRPLQPALHSTEKAAPSSADAFGRSTQPPRVGSSVVGHTAGRSHASPAQPLAHAQRPVAASHRPWLEQLTGQRRKEQSAPVNGGEHAHERVALSQTPWPEQSLRQPRREQSRPTKPTEHSQRPATHVPWPEHSFGQASSSHAMPVKLAAHSHWPSAAHVPRDAPPHRLPSALVGQTLRPHFSPAQPRSHEQAEPTHVPCPRQPSRTTSQYVVIEQSIPVQPSEHAQ